MPPASNSVTRVPLKKLHPAPWNPRRLKDQRFQNLCKSIEADPGLLDLRPILATKDGTIYGGNQRFRAVQHLGWTDVPAVLSDIPEQLAKERALKDNGAWGEWVEDDLGTLLAELKDAGSDIDLLGFDSPELDRLLQGVTQGAGGAPDARPTLSDRFLVPPFSVLDARQGYWQDRKRRWLGLGIESELGRGEFNPDPENAKGLLGFSKQALSHYAVPSGSLRPAATLGPNGKTVRGDGKGRKLANGREHTVGQNG